MKKTTYITPASTTLIVSIQKALATSPYGETGQAGPAIEENGFEGW